MAPNAPAQQPEEEPILVRGSAEHKEYLKHQFGTIKTWVNAFETRIAVAGRAMLLIYVIYITVKAGAGAALPQGIPALDAGLLVLDIFMLALQVLGLEGSVPGLTHLADDLESKGKTKEADSVRRAAGTAQFLIAATAIDVVLQYSPHVFSVSSTRIDISGLAFGYDKLLFIVRLVVIGQYLKAMARLEHKGPKIISQHEHEQQRKAKEQEQIRMDNAAIQATIAQTFDQRTKEQEQKLADAIAEIKASLVVPEITPPEVDTQALIQAVADSLIPQIQAKFQALDQELFRQKTIVTQVQDQAKALPELRQTLQMFQANRLPEKAGSIQAAKPQFKQPAQTPRPGTQAEQNVIRLVPANASREELIAEARRLHDVEGLSTYAIGEKLGKPAKTVQSWLSSKSKDQAESEVKEAAN